MKFYTGLLLALILTGCAMSPQSVFVAPRVMAPAGANLGGAVSITAYDERTSPVIGSRGGVYADSSQLRAGNNLALAVKGAADQALSVMGVDISRTDANPFQIYIDKLTYIVPEGSYVTEVTLEADIRIRVRNSQGDWYDGRYGSDLQRRVLKAPSDEENERLINEVLGMVLQRMVDDQGLQRFLQ
ncbi:YajG family lipoprotein [Spongorhabdus nitratireducens]